MTERLYYTDSKLLTFNATIVDTGQLKDCHFTILDKSAFYPTSGGQPHDLGKLNNTDVIDVVEDNLSNVRHITKSPVGAKGEKAHGEVDHARRQYFRQLHTAQHILSRAFIELFGIETVSVHLGEDYGAIELPIQSLTSEQLQSAEEFTFQVIQENQPIEIIFADYKKAAQLPLRKKPERSGTIRIIKIGELDWSACGGTHCSNTSEVGLVKLSGLEKQRAHSLVKFLAGQKVREDYALRFQATDSLSKTLTCSVADIPARMVRLSDEFKQLQRQLSQLQLQLLPAKVETLASSAITSGQIKVVYGTISDIDSKLASQLTSAVARKINGVAALVLDNRMCLAVAESANLDAGKIVKELATKLNLKGGGNKAVAHLGGLPTKKSDELKNAFLAVLNEM